ncbi:16S rRNA (cytosine(1402)-N(4))-methyltransferase RsmH [Roseateles depolymerans]|uniref:Ribosomal RNA small subunit methyltransferase H n=1 Tax=Roseateles depolymerans TaxID=76731 RepID=A0A0U3MAN0_9BURK|nr:16S rRNA (cytosine(1402)-N(4))-methyltransferase RsmH [Roseateles depolymerans]ALV05709.1 Ribosomal RNA small subunit methyltransferase H [Roseateles depolymerans]REG13021.1 16S rRNA (cytosine1402-N4)-methyltransferase [Roseateles depolymerans]
MSATPFTHTTVLLQETVEGVLNSPDGIYVDGTFGRGGHSRLLLSRLSERGRLIAIDRDPEAVAAATSGQTRVDDPRFSICHAPFADMGAQLDALNIPQVHGVLLDLGVSSPQIDNPERGFSFRFDGPLDMRMDTTRGESAAEFLARAEVNQLATVIRDYGEERFALPIAKALVARRESGRPVRSTAELSQVVAGAVKTREPGQDPATRTFQALRIFVNAELEELQQGLNAALARLVPGGRLAIISFHSLEDRIVKNFITAHSKDEVDRRAPFAAPKPLALKAIARIKPSEGEVRANPRSRSAILRVAERTDAPLPPPAPEATGKQRRGGGRR